MKFEEIKTNDELKLYLDDKRRLMDCLYLSHYTKYDRLLQILKSEKLYLSKANGMNDLLEYQNGSNDIWDKLYFFSLIMNRKESIGMWSVYAQPWEAGVKISFRTEDIRKWLLELDKIYIVGGDEKLTGEVLDIESTPVQCFHSAIAYTNTDSKDSSAEVEKVTWNTVENTNILMASKKAELTGYIKDSAWAYEREIRIKALFDSAVTYHRIALDIKPLIPYMTITTGPLFEGSLQQRLQEDLPGFDGLNYHFGQSIFQNRFRK